MSAISQYLTEIHESFPILSQLTTKPAEFQRVSYNLVPRTRAEPSKLQEIYPTFDAQNMPKSANDKVFAGFIQPDKILVFQHADNLTFNLRNHNLKNYGIIF